MTPQEKIELYEMATSDLTLKEAVAVLGVLTVAMTLIFSPLIIVRFLS